MRSTFGLALATALIVVAAGCGKKPGDTGSGGSGGSTTTPVGIDGTYVIVGMEMGGKKESEADLAKMPEDRRTTVIKGDKMTSGKDNMPIKLDSSKSPAHIDITNTKLSGKTETVYGIYKLEGDTLTICTQMKGDDKAENRPKEFKSTDKYIIMTTMKKK